MKVGTVSELWRFPVKSMAGERLSEAPVERGSIVGDRAYAVVDAETGDVVTARHVTRYTGLLDCRAMLLPGGSIQITLPDGRAAQDDGAAQLLSEYYGREVQLQRATEEKSFFDAFPFSLITSSTIDHLQELLPDSRVDTRRFRMNATLATEGRGFIENSWALRKLVIGDAMTFNIGIPDARCVMTTLAQSDLPRDPAVLKALTEHNRLDVGDGKERPCAGVYATAETNGTLRVGDSVHVVRP